MMGFDDLLVQHARLERGAVTLSATGEEVVTWALEQAAVPVLVRPARVPADLRPGEQETVTHVIFSRPNRALQEDPRGHWRMLVGGREYVLIDPEDAAARGHHLEIRARRLG